MTTDLSDLALDACISSILWAAHRKHPVKSPEGLLALAETLATTLRQAAIEGVTHEDLFFYAHVYADSQREKIYPVDPSEN